MPATAPAGSDENKKPRFMSVTEMLIHSVNRTVGLLTKELEILMSELNQSWHDASLERIFIENHIYNLIENCETWESIVETIDKMFGVKWSTEFNSSWKTQEQAEQLSLELEKASIHMDKNSEEDNGGKDNDSGNNEDK